MHAFHPWQRTLHIIPVDEALSKQRGESPSMYDIALIGKKVLAQAVLHLSMINIRINAKTDEMIHRDRGHGLDRPRRTRIYNT